MDVKEGLNNLKKHVFFEMMNLAGRVFVLVGYSENVILGNRGFTAEEKENGIVLVFNLKMNFMWDDYGISATLVFGTSPQKCFIPAADIISVYSPELNTQFVASPQPAAPDGGKTEPEAPRPRVAKKISEETGRSTGNVIKVDFTKKRK